jgi:branched-chain amino acid transport system substrate-binding protein
MSNKLISSVAFIIGLSLSSVAYADIKIGVGAPLTGINASFGDQYRNGAQLAAADINAAGGILGQKIELVYGDDRSDPSEGVKVAARFASEGVKMVVGHFNSGVSIPASEVYAENDILMVTPGSTNPAVTERGLWNTFRMCGRDDQQGLVAAEYIAANLKGKKVAIVHDRTTYGQGLADEARKSLSKKGIKEALYEGVNPGEKDYSAIVQKIKSAGAEVVFWGGLHPEAGIIVNQMHKQGVKATLVGGDGLAPDEFATIAGPGAVGTLMTFAPDPRIRPQAKEVVEKFKAKNINSEFYTLYSYATVQVMAEAAKRANSLEPKKVAEAIRSGKPFKTIIGDLSFDDKGDITRPDFVMYTWQKVGEKVTPVQM